jgi:hypothetical protein
MKMMNARVNEKSAFVSEMSLQAELEAGSDREDLAAYWKNEYSGFSDEEYYTPYCSFSEMVDLGNGRQAVVPVSKMDMEIENCYIEEVLRQRWMDEDKSYWERRLEKDQENGYLENDQDDAYMYGADGWRAA